MAESGKLNLVKNSSDDSVSGRKEQILCQPCSRKDLQTTADVFCSECDEFQCSECSKAHTVYAFMKNHQLENAAEAKSKPATFDMKGMDNCEQHGELLKFFCEDENQLCCSTCAVVDHRKCHSVVEVQKIAGKSRSDGFKLIKNMEEVKSKAEMIVKHIDSSKEQLSKDIKAIFVEIKRMRDDMNKMFDDLEVYVTRETDEFQAEVTNTLEKKRSSVKKHKADVTKSLDIVDTVSENGTPSQQFIVKQKIKRQANELYRDVDNECQNLQIATVSFKFDKTLKLRPLPISAYVPGKLTLKYTLPETKKSVAPVNPQFKLTKITSIDLKQTGDDVEEPLYTGLDFLPDGRLFAIDNKNKQCLIYNEKLEKVGSYQVLYSPQSVVAISEEEVAVTGGGQYQIDFLRVSKSNEITLIRTCIVCNMTENRYASICLKDDKNFVVGTIDDTTPVRIVSMSGEEKDFSVSFPNKKYSINTIACNYIRNTEKLILTDRHEHTVYIYDVATNTRVVVKDDQIKEPRGVAVGPSDCILVCSGNTNSIVQISQTGRILLSFKLDMKYPYRVCVSKDKSILAVTNSRKGKTKLQLFKLTY
ncbi:E3 ubiquitin-protein ligase TRIM71-like [Mercenaria mercenaria]|uniref:E3 ubiquitin-protein ligase TRIM71-like n=1 Tax=Mercenaria mercenaria TaxID=6596 RepID=UPI00234E62F7|nr:E3 ubiquitin-protein ligase TRIM71-like [Mercenaria mercenaria]